MPDYRKIFAQKAAAKKRAMEECCQELDNEPGIYVFYREDENGIKHAYIGQAKHLLDRVADHFLGYQHIDLSIRKHGMYKVDNPHGYVLALYTHCKVDYLDEEEKRAIKFYANLGYQLKNKTAGGQGEGKSGLDNNKPSRNYHDGLNQGYENARNYVKNLFAKYLEPKLKQPDNKIKLRKYMEFKEWLGL